MAKKQVNGLWFILGLVVLIGAMGLILFQINSSTIVPASWGNTAGTRTGLFNWLNLFQQSILSPIIAAVFGILIVNRYSRHRVGWLLIGISFTSVITILLGELVVYGYFTVPSPIPGIGWAAWVTNWLWVVLFSCLLLMLAIFPNGRFVNRRWAIIQSVLLASFLVFMIVGSAFESSMSSAFQIPNPLGENAFEDIGAVLFNIGVLAMPLTAMTLVLSAVVRFRRGQGRERQQMKWLLGGVILLVMMLVVGLAFSSIEGFALGEMMVNASILGPVLGIGAALLRHQLYDIDIILRRTLVYSMVSALLVVIYFGSVVVLQGLVTAVGGQQSGFVVAVSTLVIAALFNPIRKRIQGLVDRRFYRQKYDAAQTLTHFVNSVKDEVELSELQQALTRAVTETLQPSSVTLWFKTDIGLND